MAKRRRFTREFKAEVVLEALRGESSQAELCRRIPDLETLRLETQAWQLKRNAEAKGG